MPLTTEGRAIPFIFKPGLGPRVRWRDGAIARLSELRGASPPTPRLCLWSREIGDEQVDPRPVCEALLFRRDRHRSDQWSLPDRAKSSSLAKSAASATNQKRTPPCYGLPRLVQPSGDLGDALASAPAANRQSRASRCRA